MEGKIWLFYGYFIDLSSVEVREINKLNYNSLSTTKTSLELHASVNEAWDGDTYGDPSVGNSQDQHDLDKS